MRITKLHAVATLAALFATGAQAQSYVAPAGNATVEGAASTALPFGNGSDTSIAEQFLYGTSVLGGLSTGSVITGLSFRADAAQSPQATALSYSSYSISLGGSTRAIGSLSTDQASNEAAGTAQVRSGALTIPAGSFDVGGSPNAFTSIVFATPYVYTGGDLLLSIAWTASARPKFTVDAVGVGNGVDSVASSAGLGSEAHYFNAPVVRFDTLAPTAAVPEAATWAMMLVGVGLVGGALRRRSDVRFDARVKRVAAGLAA